MVYRFNSDGEVDVLFMYFENKLNPYRKLLMLMSPILTFITVYWSIMNSTTFDMSNRFSLILAFLVFILLTGIVILFFNALTTIVILFLAIAVESDNSVKIKAEEFLKNSNLEPLCYVQKLKIKNCSREITVDSFSYFSLETGTEVKIELGTELCLAVVEEEEPVFNRKYLETMEILRSDLV